MARALDHAWRAAVPAQLVLAASATLEREVLPAVTLCPTLLVTGLECPGCGLTRAFIAIAHGRLAEALELNAGSLVAFAAVLAVAAAPLLRRLAPVTFARVTAELRRPRAGAIAVVLVLLTWVAHLARALVTSARA